MHVGGAERQHVEVGVAGVGVTARTGRRSRPLGCDQLLVVLVDAGRDERLRVDLQRQRGRHRVVDAGRHRWSSSDRAGRTRSASSAPVDGSRPTARRRSSCCSRCRTRRRAPTSGARDAAAPRRASASHGRRCRSWSSRPRLTTLAVVGVEVLPAVDVAVVPAARSAAGQPVVEAVGVEVDAEPGAPLVLERPVRVDVAAEVQPVAVEVVRRPLVEVDVVWCARSLPGVSHRICSQRSAGSGRPAAGSRGR